MFQVLAIKTNPLLIRVARPKLGLLKMNELLELKYVHKEWNVIHKNHQDSLIRIQKKVVLSGYDPFWVLSNSAPFCYRMFHPCSETRLKNFEILHVRKAVVLCLGGLPDPGRKQKRHSFNL